MSLMLSMILVVPQDMPRESVLADYYDAAADYTSALVEIEGLPANADKPKLEVEAMAAAMKGLQRRAAECGTSFVLPAEFSAEPRLYIDPSAKPESVRCLKQDVPFAVFEAK